MWTSSVATCSNVPSAMPILSSSVIVDLVNGIFNLSANSIGLSPAITGQNLIALKCNRNGVYEYPTMQLLKLPGILGQLT